jgi:hypothetical protein
MRKIRVTGRRSRDERCAICHGEAADAFRRCGGCSVMTHADCLAAHRRCPTLGCAEPIAKARVVGPVTHRHGLPSASSQAELIRAMRVPQHVSFALGVAGLLACAWPIVAWGTFERWLMDVFHAARADRPLVLGAGLFAFAFVVVAPTLFAFWFSKGQRDLIRRVPGILACEPITMTVTVSSEKDDEGDTVWRADLDAKGITLRLYFGLERPEWLASERSVRVFNADESPIFIETSDGRLREHDALWRFD